MIGLLLSVLVLGGAFAVVRYLEKGEEKRREAADREREAYNAAARAVGEPAMRSAASASGAPSAPVPHKVAPAPSSLGSAPVGSAACAHRIDSIACAVGDASTGAPPALPQTDQAQPGPGAAPSLPAQSASTGSPDRVSDLVPGSSPNASFAGDAGVVATPAFEQLEAHVAALEQHLALLKTDLAALKREQRLALHAVPSPATAPVQSAAAAFLVPQQATPVPPCASELGASPASLLSEDAAPPAFEPAAFGDCAVNDAWTGAADAFAEPLTTGAVGAHEEQVVAAAAHTEAVVVTAAVPGSGDAGARTGTHWGATATEGERAKSRGEAGAFSAEEDPSVSWLEQAWQWLCSLGVSRFIAASNIWALVGIGIMLMGVVLLVRYAATIVDFGPVPRLSTAGVVGFVLLALGWRQQGTHRELGLILQGGGVGALYLTVFAGMRFYELIPAPLAFGLLVGIVIFSTFLAIVQNAKIMAHVAYGAGFMAPVLVSSNSGNYIGLFSYYILLNLGIIAVSRYKNWRSLHVTGFLFTVVIGGLWGMRSYSPEKFLAVEGFLAAFFFIFTYFALAGSHPSRFNWRERSTLLIDVPVTLGTPLAAIFFQAAIVRGMPFVLAFSSLFLGFFYLGIAWYLFGKTTSLAGQADGGAGDVSGTAGPEEKAAQGAAYRQGFSLLVQIYLVLGVLFANLTLPFALYDMSLEHWRERLLSLIWVVEGACVFWLGCRNQISLFRYIGKGSMAIGLVLLIPYFLMGTPDYSVTTVVGQLADGTDAMVTRLDYGTLLASILFHMFSLAGLLASAYSAWKFPYALWGLRQEHLSRVFLGLFAGVATAVFSFEFARLPFSGEAAMLLLFAIFGFLAGKKAEHLGWKDLRLCALLPYLPFVYLAFGLFASVVVLLLATIGWGSGAYDILSFSWIWYALESTGFVLFTHAVIAGFSGLELFQLRPRSAEKDDGETAAPLFVAWRYPLAFNTLALLLFQGTFYYLDRVLELGISLALLRLLALVWCVPFFYVLLRQLTPETLGKTLWLRMSFAPLLIAVGWFFGSLLWDAGPSRFVHVPLFNFVEVGLLCCLALVFFWAQAAVRGNVAGAWLRYLLRREVLLGVVFVVLNLSVLRATAAWEGLPFTLWGMIRNPGSQAYLAILWAVCGFSTMLYGHKHRSKQLWLAGGALILFDVAKLLIFEVKRMETLWLIVALFIVGGLLLAISYYMPTPPTDTKPETKEAGGEE